MVYGNAALFRKYFFNWGWLFINVDERATDGRESAAVCMFVHVYEKPSSVKEVLPKYGNIAIVNWHDKWEN